MVSFSQEKIILDQKTFKALAVNSRVDILKELNSRRKTQSELAQVIGLSVATIKEHLDKMEDAQLIKQKDDGHKWKYYELTEKGRCVLYPERKKIWIVLISLFLVAGFSFFTTFNDVYFSTLPKADFNAQNSQLMASVSSPIINPEMARGMEMDSVNAQDSAEIGLMATKSISTMDLEAPSSIVDTTNYDNSYSSAQIKFPVLQYLSYALLILLFGLFVYYLSSYNSSSQNKN